VTPLLIGLACAAVVLAFGNGYSKAYSP